MRELVPRSVRARIEGRSRRLRRRTRHGLAALQAHGGRRRQTQYKEKRGRWRYHRPREMTYPSKRMLDNNGLIEGFPLLTSSLIPHPSSLQLRFRRPQPFLDAIQLRLRSLKIIAQLLHLLIPRAIAHFRG